MTTILLIAAEMEQLIAIQLQYFFFFFAKHICLLLNNHHHTRQKEETKNKANTITHT